MTPRAFLAGSVVAAALAVPSLAAAVPGYTTGNVNVRTGPGTQYQVITTAGAGSGVEILGCLPGRAWCDVALGNLRGWVSGNYVREAGVVVQQYVEPRYVAPRYITPGPSVSFSFGRYWDDDDDWRYRDRPRYSHRDRDRDRYDRDGRDRDGRDRDGRDRDGRADWQRGGDSDRAQNRGQCVDGFCGPFGK